jgi:hypothetical protein
LSATRDAARLIAITPVKPDRREDFEEFVRGVIVPAVNQTAPHLSQMWQTLRPSQDADGCDYVFVFYGDASVDEWDLERLLPATYGDMDGHTHMQHFLELLSGEQQIYSFSGQVAGG